MKFTVLGATGFIGSYLARHLVEDGHEVWSPAKNEQSIFSNPLGHAFYCIGLTADFRQRPFETLRAHVGLLGDILERADFTTLTYFSSTRVYLRSEQTSEDDSLVVAPNDPGDLYNLSKLAGESLCWSSKRAGVRAVRVSNVVGYDLHSQNFMFSLIREAKAGQIALRTTLDSCKDYILIDDLVALLPRIALDGERSLYNVASGVNLSNQAIVERLSLLTGCQSTVAPDAVSQKSPVINISRIKNEFGFYSTPVLPRLDLLIKSGEYVH